MKERTQTKAQMIKELTDEVTKKLKKKSKATLKNIMKESKVKKRRRLDVSGIPAIFWEASNRELAMGTEPRLIYRDSRGIWGRTQTVKKLVSWRFLKSDY